MKRIVKSTRVIILSVSCWLALSVNANTTPSVAVEIATVARQEVASQMWVSGSVVSKYDARIASEASGRITWIAEEGEYIKRGGVIATIDDRELKLQEKTRNADVQRLKARTEYLSRQVERFKSLATTRNTSVSTLDGTISELAMVQQELIAARVALEQTQLDITQSKVRAPFEGIIVERLQMPGEFAQEGKVLVRLVNTSDLEVSANAPLAISRFVKKNKQTIVKGEFDQVSTSIRTVIPVGDTRSRMIEIRVALNKGEWVIGEAVKVSLDNAMPVAAVAVPRDALVLREDAVYLFKLEGGSIARRISVKTHTGHDDVIFVEGDISENDKVIIRGAERLKDGQSVKVIKQSVALR